MRITIKHDADEDARFAPDAFGKLIGAEFPITAPGYYHINGTLVGATVSGDGRSVDLTIEVRHPDGGPP